MRNLIFPDETANSVYKINYINELNNTKGFSVEDILNRKTSKPKELKAYPLKIRKDLKSRDIGRSKKILKKKLREMEILEATKPK